MMNEDISIIDGQNSFLTEKSTVLLTQAKRTLEDEKEMITPPSSTVRKTMKEVNKRPSHPLSPDHSSPIAPSKAKRQRSDTCARSNGNLTLEEILQSLERRRINGELAKKPSIFVCNFDLLGHFAISGGKANAIPDISLDPRSLPLLQAERC